MAGLEISKLPPLSEAALQDADELAIVDKSAVETKKITSIDLVRGGVQNLSPGDIDPNVIDWANTPADSIDGSAIVNNSIGQEEIGTDAVGSDELANGAVDEAAILNGSVTTDKLGDGSVTTDKIADNAITDDKIQANGLSNGSIGAGAITYDKTSFQDGDIPGAKIEDLSITDGQLADGSVVTSKLADLAVTTAKINDLAVTRAKIANEAISDEQIDIDGITRIATASVTESMLQNGSVSTDKIQDEAVTDDKIAAGVDGGKIADGTIQTAAFDDNVVTGDVLANGAVDTIHLVDGSVTDDKIDSVDGSKLVDGSVTATKFNPTAFSEGLEIEEGVVVHVNEIAPGTRNGITFDAQGHISDTAPLQPGDLPLATASSVGAISVPAGSGLTIDAAGAIDHQTLLAAGEESGISHDEHGHITGTRPLIGTDLPPATATTLGAVIVTGENSNPLNVDDNGNIFHNVSALAPGTYASLQIDQYGHAVDGDTILAPEQVPSLNADKINAGQFPTARIADNSITDVKIADYATCLMQEDFPGAGEFLGQFWYTPSTAQLRVYSRGSGPQNIWLPVGFGALQQQNLRVGFTYDATTATVITVTAYGVQAGITPGALIPDPDDIYIGIYGVCVVGGDQITVNDLVGVSHNPGDWILCLGETQGWVHVDVNEGNGPGGGGGALVLNDLLDVTIGFTGRGIDDPAPTVALQDGQILQYNATVGQWVNVDFAGGATISEDPPNLPEGSLWWNSSDEAGGGRLYVSYNDGSSTQWVPATPDAYGTGTGGGGGDSGGGGTPGEIELLNDLTDVNAIPTASNDFLVWDDSAKKWVATNTLDGGSF